MQSLLPPPPFHYSANFSTKKPKCNHDELGRLIHSRTSQSTSHRLILRLALRFATRSSSSEARGRCPCRSRAGHRDKAARRGSELHPPHAMEKAPASRARHGSLQGRRRRALPELWPGSKVLTGAASEERRTDGHNFSLSSRHAADPHPSHNNQCFDELTRHRI